MKINAIFLLFILFLYTPPVSPNVFSPARMIAYASSEKFIRTELYFGLTKPDKMTVSDGEWSDFVDQVITPRFPDGFTVIDGKGQWRNKEGNIAKESSKVFIVVYPRASRKGVSRKIDEIRDEYKRRFEQESVLRVDITKSVVVSF